MKNFLILAFIILASNVISAQTFSGIGGPIPSNGDSACYSIKVEGLEAAVLDTSFGVLQVGINIKHPYDITLEVILIAPDGTQVILSSGNGDDGANYTNTYFDDRAATYITAATAPFSGRFRPNEILGSVNNGQPSNGIWKLMVLDNYPELGEGPLLNWSITFGNNATGPDTTFTSSNLPIVMLNTYGQVILDEPKIPAMLKIINNGPGARNYINDPPQFIGNSGVERRGSLSQVFPKKSYGIETWDASGKDLDTSLLGMPSESDWILNASFTDKSLMRNALSYQVWQNMGHYATRYQFVELVINGQYKGVYLFLEKIKRNKDRVNVAKLKPDENAGDSLTGGYILKIDKLTGSGGSGWTSKYPPSSHVYNQTIFFQYEYPNEIDITPQQKTYIQTYILDFENALSGANFGDTIIGFRKYAVESTFIDYFIINEISKNVDAYRASTFLQKESDRKGGKLRMGPVWDYDLAWHNANFCSGDLYTGWAYKFPCNDHNLQVPFWWNRLLEDTLYTTNLRCRWEYLRQTILSNASLDEYIDSIVTQLGESQLQNFKTWPIFGMYIYVNAWPYAANYQGEINLLKTWMHKRLSWLDANMPGTCNSTASFVANKTYRIINVYPNPATNKITITTTSKSKGETQVSIFSINGQLIQRNKFQNTDMFEMDLSTMQKGIYLLRIQNAEGVETQKLVLQY
jgi:subtilisin-like proprotein convertase family protein